MRLILQPDRDQAHRHDPLGQADKAHGYGRSDQPRLEPGGELEQHAIKRDRPQFG